MPAFIVIKYNSHWSLVTLGRSKFAKVHVELGAWVLDTLRPVRVIERACLGG